MTLVETFSGLPDSRRGPAKRYVLMEMVVMALCAILCGADHWVEVADWCRDRQQCLRERFGWSLKGGTPSHDPFGDLFRVLDAKGFEERFRQWIAGLVGVVDGVAAFDGKTLRGSGKKGSNELLHLVTAYVVENGKVAAASGSMQAYRQFNDTLASGLTSAISW